MKGPDPTKEIGHSPKHPFRMIWMKDILMGLVSLRTGRVESFANWNPILDKTEPVGHVPAHGDTDRSIHDDSPAASADMQSISLSFCAYACLSSTPRLQQSVFNGR
jgi:hypothetical protein